MRFTRIEKDRYLLDVRGFTCPYPVIYTRKALKQIEDKAILEVLIDNPPSCETVPAAARDEGHEVLGIERIDNGVWRILIRKKG